jgi:hypothetical protein
MANLFDSANAPTREPDNIKKGALTQWSRPDFSQDYPPSEYNLLFTALSECGDHRITAVSAANGSGDHAFSLSSGTTGQYYPADYRYQVEIQRISDSERVFAYSGSITVTPDFDRASEDPRSHAAIMLSKVESILEGRADKDVSSYSINGRSLTKMGIDELIRLRGMYRQEVKNEKSAEDVANGRASQATIKVRFQ